MRRSGEVDNDAVSAAVWQLLADRGLEGLNLRAVADTAGCTTGLLMHRFGSRSGLLTHARALLFDRMVTRIDALDLAALPPRDGLQRMLEQTLTLDDERAEEARVWLGFLAAAVSSSALADLHAQRNRTWLDRIARAVDRARPGAPPDRVHHTAASLVALTDGLAALSIGDPVTYAPSVQRVVLDRHIDLLLADLDPEQP